MADRKTESETYEKTKRIPTESPAGERRRRYDTPLTDTDRHRRHTPPRTPRARRVRIQHVARTGGRRTARLNTAAERKPKTETENSKKGAERN